jgi:hypothetical protein
MRARYCDFRLLRKTKLTPSSVLRPPSFFVFVVLLLSGVGCGYRLAGSNATAPGDIRSLSVGTFENESREFGLDRRLTFALEGEFYRRGLLRVVEDPDGGEAVLSGTIRSFTTRPVAFDSRDEALQYEAELTLDAELKRRIDGVILWKASGMTAIEDYVVARSVVVPSSSQFQRGTLDLDDLDALTNIQLAETEKRLAIKRLLGSIVVDLHDRLLDDF